MMTWKHYYKKRCRNRKQTLSFNLRPGRISSTPHAGNSNPDDENSKFYRYLDTLRLFVLSREWTYQLAALSTATGFSLQIGRPSIFNSGLHFDFEVLPRLYTK